MKQSIHRQWSMVILLLFSLNMATQGQTALSFYNRVTVYNYDINYDLGTYDDQTSDYGQWNSQTHTWANGEAYRPLPENDPEEKWIDSSDVWEVGKETENSPLQFNVDLRLGIAYNWRNYFIGAQMQLNNFFYNKGLCKVNIFDAYLRASLGIRL